MFSPALGTGQQLLRFSWLRGSSGSRGITVWQRVRRFALCSDVHEYQGMAGGNLWERGGMVEYSGWDIQGR